MADEVKRVRVELDVVAVGADKAKTEIDNAAQNRTVNVGSGVASGGAAVGGGGGGSVRSAGSRSQQEANAQWFADDASGTGLLRYASDNPNGSRAQRDLRQEIQGARAWQQTVFSDQDRQMAGFERQESRIQSARIANRDRYGRSVSSARAAASPLRAIPRPTADTAAESIINSIQRNAPIEATKQGALEAERYLAGVASDNANIEQIQEWGLNTPRSQPQRAPLAGPSARQPGSGGGAGRGRGGLFGNIQVRGLAAIYAGYRFAEAEAEDYKRYQMADALGKAGYGGEATEALYQNAKDVATDPWKRLAVTMQNYTTAFTGVAGIASADKYGGDPEQRLRDAEQAMIATHSAGVGMTRNANIASMRQSMGTSAYAAQNAWIQDPIQAAQFGQDLAGRQAGDANDAAVRELTAKMTPDLNPVERGKLAYDIVAKLGQRSTEMDQARAAKEPEIAGARKQQWFGVQQARSQAWGMVGSAQGNPQLALWAQLDEKYRPIFNAASGSDPASRAMLAQQTANYQGEWALGTRAINASVAQSAASVWGNAAAISGDFGTQRRAAWADFGAATQGMVQGSPDYQREFNTRMQQDQNISAREREAWAYAAGSGAVAAAQAAGQNFTQAHMSAYQRFNVATANAAPGTAGYIAASNEYYGTVETLKREQYGWNASQEAQITSANFRANFKPTQGAIADIANSAVQEMIKANDPGQRDILVKKGKAQLSAFANQWLAGSTAGNFAEGMWFQAGTGGLETGYEGPNEIGRALKTSSQKLEAAVTHPQVINYADFGN